MIFILHYFHWHSLHIDHDGVVHNALWKKRKVAADDYDLYEAPPYSQSDRRYKIPEVSSFVISIALIDMVWLRFCSTVVISISTSAQIVLFVSTT